MPLQDLTPQLRTRLSRLEFLVGFFVTAAVLLILLGLGYYIYLRAERKGWFLQKLPYFTFVRNAAGLNVGDKVKLMGFDVGEVLEITPEAPGAYYDVFVRFEIWEPYYGYLWDDSKARVEAADLFGKRSIEVTKGISGIPTYLFRPIESVPLDQAASPAAQDQFDFAQHVGNDSDPIARACQPVTPQALQQLAALGSNRVAVMYRKPERPLPTGIWDPKTRHYQPYDKRHKGYFLEPDESPALTERLESVIDLVQANLPQFLDLTNRIADLLDHATQAVARADAVLAAAQPIATNLAFITTHLREPRGGLGQWLLPTNLNTHLTQTLATLHTTLQTADRTVTHTDAHLGLLVTNLNASLQNLAHLTSNLNAQVQANTNLVSRVNQTIADLDHFVQGLQQHWLLRSAFKKPKPANTRPPSQPPYKVRRSPRDPS
ncbi:MAG: MCE family protein [Verrucomicrobia bacterium]|nr:MCE family protein [Verrucomicrobiota bacterium]